VVSFFGAAGEGGTGKRTPKSRNLLLQSKPGASSAEQLEKQWVND
jgi:hypothetical protein